MGKVYLNSKILYIENELSLKSKKVVRFLCSENCIWSYNAFNASQAAFAKELGVSRQSFNYTLYELIRGLNSLLYNNEPVFKMYVLDGKINVKRCPNFPKLSSKRSDLCYELKNILKFKSGYSLFLYEKFLSMFKGADRAVISVDNIPLSKGYRNNADKMLALRRATGEINRYTDIECSIKNYRDGNYLIYAEKRL